MSNELENKLEEFLIENTPDKLEEVFDTLLHSECLILSQHQAENEETSEEEAEPKIHVQMAQSSDGTQYIPVFTSEEEIDILYKEMPDQPQPKVLAMEGWYMLALSFSHKSDVIINPHKESALFIPTDIQKEILQVYTDQLDKEIEDASQETEK
ncbi:MAG TPA: SseB family protein [Alphaproteobacteria bacterium]|nr:SseB family protein [Alphaproteobacteria bacterium]HOO50854.1 SseB family protein [Alphaproteobacteria bacterium]